MLFFYFLVLLLGLGHTKLTSTTSRDRDALCLVRWVVKGKKGRVSKKCMINCTKRVNLGLYSSKLKGKMVNRLAFIQHLSNQFDFLKHFNTLVTFTHSHTFINRCVLSNKLRDGVALWAILGSVFCPRPLGHVECWGEESWHRSSDRRMTRSTNWVKAAHTKGAFYFCDFISILVHSKLNIIIESSFAARPDARLDKKKDKEIKCLNCRTQLKTWPTDI